MPLVREGTGWRGRTVSVGWERPGPGPALLHGSRQATVQGLPFPPLAGNVKESNLRFKKMTWGPLSSVPCIISSISSSVSPCPTGSLDAVGRPSDRWIVISLWTWKLDGLVSNHRCVT